MPVKPSTTRDLQRRLAEIDRLITNYQRDLEVLSREAAAIRTVINPKMSSPSLAARIRNTLASFSRPAGPAEVASRLLASGLKWTNPNRRFGHAVNLELCRMAKRPATSMVCRVSKGKYEFRQS